MDKQLLKLNIHPSQIENEFTFLTDGPLHLRQALLPECSKKDLQLPFFFYEYFDLRREFSKFAPATTPKPSSLSDIASCKTTFPSFSRLRDQVSKSSYSKGLLIEEIDDERVYSLKQCKVIEKICLHMIKNGILIYYRLLVVLLWLYFLSSEGHLFDNSETISRELEHGIW